MTAGPFKQLPGKIEALEAEQFVALARASHGDGASWLLALREETFGPNLDPSTREIEVRLR